LVPWSQTMRRSSARSVSITAGPAMPRLGRKERIAPPGSGFATPPPSPPARRSRRGRGELRPQIKAMPPPPSPASRRGAAPPPPSTVRGHPPRAEASLLPPHGGIMRGAPPPPSPAAPGFAGDDLRGRRGGREEEGRTAAAAARVSALGRPGGGRPKRSVAILDSQQSLKRTPVVCI
jgi:hypothetical protein